MNLTRDSIKRNAHPAYIAWILSSALPERNQLVLNADDLIASSVGDRGESAGVLRGRPDRDRRHRSHRRRGGCLDLPGVRPRLDWVYWRFNHIGKAVLPEHADSAPPTPQYRASETRRSAPAR